MKLRIVHITDIHLSESNSNAFENFYLKALTDDLVSINNDRKIDIICLTGDLLDKGGSSLSISENKYIYFIDKFWAPLFPVLGMKNEQLFIVPGNHDINRNEIEEFVESGLFTNLVTLESVNNFIRKYKNKSHSGIERQSEYKGFERLFYGHNKDSYVSNFESCHVIDIAGKRIGIVCLNTSWRCGTNLSDNNLVMGTEQITNASSFFREKKCDFVIGLMHHPIDFISDIEREEILSKLRNTGYDLVLFGHTHAGITKYETGNNGNLCISTARTGFGNPRENIDKYKSGYTIIDINDFEVKFSYRVYVNSRVKFDKDTLLADNGEYITNLLPRSGKEKFHKLMSISDSVRKSQLDIINEALVIHGTDSVAPRNVNDIFVLPKLTDTPVAYGSLEDDKLYDIRELITSADNILFSGDKESGKSTLLNKILVEVSADFSTYEKIPVKIDFNSVQQRDVKNIIKSFLNSVSSAELEALLNDGKILLLVDNVYSYDENEYISKRLQSFMDKWPSVKLIAATHVDAESFIENETNILSSFKKIYIGNVGAKEFKSLATKWFEGRSSSWLKSHLSVLIKIFEKLKISRTFFSISLFLWIVEKNSGFKPTNNYDLLYTFLTYILEGFSLENANAGSYNFTKKLELLTEISYEMYKSGDKENGYSLKEDKVISVVQSNFNANQLNLRAPEKVNDFLGRGLLKYVQSTGLVQFRFESFFHFFLARAINSNDEFKIEVLEDRNFLNFIEELDFYTGYKRNDKRILLRAVQELKKGFAGLGDGFDETNPDGFFPDTPLLFNGLSANAAYERAKGMKLSDEEVEEAMEKHMDLLPINSSIAIKKDIPNKLVFSHSLEMATRILKNSENIKDPALVNYVLDLIISKSAIHSVYMQSLLMDQMANAMAEKGESWPIDVPMQTLMYFGPIMAQEVLSKWGGTEFLEIPLAKKIHRFIDSETEYSEIELFMAVFMYSDIKGPNHPEMLRAAVERMHNKFVLELSYLKILSYYMVKSEGSPLVKVYENIMVSIMCKVKNLSKSVARKIIQEGARNYKNSQEGEIVHI